MSNIIDKIQLSGVTYDLPSGSGNPTVELTQAQYDALVSGGTVDPDTYYIITDATPQDMSQYWTSAQTNSAITQAVSGKADTSAVTESINAAVSGKQDTLVSGTNIKTINNESILGNGNIDIQGGGGGKAVSGGTNISITTGETADTINCTLPISADSKGIYTTSTYPFLSSSNKSGNVVFGYNNRLDTFGSTKSSNYNLFFGSDNYITVNGSGMLIGGKNNHNQNNGNYLDLTACVVLGGSNMVGNPCEFASGQFNQTYYASTAWGNSGNTLFSVGNGTSDNARHNAFEIRQNGDIYITSGGTDIKLQDNLGGGGSSYTAGDGIDITNDVISVTGKVETSAITSAVTSGSTDVVTSGGVYDQLGGMKIVKLTESEYTALVTKDSNTLYVVVPDPSN